VSITFTAARSRYSRPTLDDRLADPGLLSLGAFLSVSAALLVPIVLYLGGAAPLARILYPAMALFLGGFLYLHRSPWYIGYTILLFCFASLVRRLADYQGGFQVSSLILTAPYLICMLGAFSALRYLAPGRNPYTGPFLAILCSIAYGALLAVLQDRFMLGMTDLLKWASGPLLAIHILSQWQRGAAMRQVITSTLLVVAPVMGIYGLMQFIYPTPWDAEWVNNVRLLGFDSVGVPGAFSLRVFSTMNAPGSMAAYLMIALLIAMSRSFSISVPVMIACALGLALAQYRTLWGATSLGLVLLLLWGTPQEKMRISLGAIVLVFSAGFLALIPEMQFALEQRLNSLSSLNSDASGAERMMQYVRFFIDNDNLLIGDGFGLNYYASVSGSANAVVDSGILDSVRALGIFGGAFYFISLFMLILSTFQSDPTPGSKLYLYRVLVIIAFIQIPLGAVHIAEVGVLNWIMLATALTFTASRVRMAS
jgi:hypothetical protein